jgi:hypothetical protein
VNPFAELFYPDFKSAAISIMMMMMKDSNLILKHFKILVALTKNAFKQIKKKARKG